MTARNLRMKTKPNAPKMTNETQRHLLLSSHRQFSAFPQSEWLWAPFTTLSRGTTRILIKRRDQAGEIASDIICPVMTALWRRAEPKTERGIIGWSTRKIYQSLLKGISDDAGNHAVPSAAILSCSEKVHFFIIHFHQASQHSLTRRIWDQPLVTCPLNYLYLYHMVPMSARCRLLSVQDLAFCRGMMMVEL